MKIIAANTNIQDLGNGTSEVQINVGTEGSGQQIVGPFATEPEAFAAAQKATQDADTPGSKPTFGTFANSDGSFSFTNTTAIGFVFINVTTPVSAFEGHEAKDDNPPSMIDQGTIDARREGRPVGGN